MRRFVPGGVVSEDVLARLLHAAHAAPSVGLMQPWRFIRITDETLKRRIHALVDDERLLTAEALGAREEEFLALKVEGILDCDSENLQIPQYKHSVVMGVNKAKVPGKGSAFFFHTTDGGPTAGCVAIDDATLVQIIRWLRPGAVIAIAK